MQFYPVKTPPIGLFYGHYHPHLIGKENGTQKWLAQILTKLIKGEARAQGQPSLLSGNTFYIRKA